MIDIYASKCYHIDKQSYLLSIYDLFCSQHLFIIYFDCDILLYRNNAISIYFDQKRQNRFISYSGELHKNGGLL